MLPGWSGFAPLLPDTLRTRLPCAGTNRIRFEGLRLSALSAPIHRTPGNSGDARRRRSPVVINLPLWALSSLHLAVREIPVPLSQSPRFPRRIGTGEFAGLVRGRQPSAGRVLSPLLGRLSSFQCAVLDPLV